MDRPRGHKVPEIVDTSRKRRLSLPYSDDARTRGRNSLVEQKTKIGMNEMGRWKKGEEENSGGDRWSSLRAVRPAQDADCAELGRVVEGVEDLCV